MLFYLKMCVYARSVLAGRWLLTGTPHKITLAAVSCTLMCLYIVCLREGAVDNLHTMAIHTVLQKDRLAHRERLNCTDLIRRHNYLHILPNFQRWVRRLFTTFKGGIWFPTFKGRSTDYSQLSRKSQIIPNFQRGGCTDYVQLSKLGPQIIPNFIQGGDILFPTAGGGCLQIREESVIYAGWNISRGSQFCRRFRRGDWILTQVFEGV